MIGPKRFSTEITKPKKELKMNFSRKDKLLPAVGVGLAIVVIGYYVLTTPDRRDPGQKISDAIGELHNGPEKAARELESRTPGDKLQDAVHDEKEDIKKAINQP
jgi:hypothetical protein